jgi:hypothetical protein
MITKTLATDELALWWDIHAQAEHLQSLAAKLRGEADNLRCHADDLDARARGLFSAIDRLGREMPDPTD